MTRFASIKNLLPPPKSRYHNLKRCSSPMSHLVLGKVLRGRIESPRLSVLTCRACADRATTPTNASLDETRSGRKAETVGLTMLFIECP